MNKTINKKGISTIVATVLIVLITVAAVTILWTAIAPLIDRDLSSETLCFNAQNALKIDGDRRYTCIVVDEGFKYRIERKANTKNIEGFAIYVEADGETVATKISSTLPLENGLEIYREITPNLEDGYTDISDISISIAPRVLVEGEIVSCAKSTPVTIVQCPT